MGAKIKDGLSDLCAANGITVRELLEHTSDGKIKLESLRLRYVRWAKDSPEKLKSKIAECKTKLGRKHRVEGMVTAREVDEIIERSKTESGVSLGLEYKLSRSAISRIKNGSRRKQG